MIKLSPLTKKGYVRLSIRVMLKGGQITKNLGINVHKNQVRRKRIVNLCLNLITLKMHKPLQGQEQHNR